MWTNQSTTTQVFIPSSLVCHHTPGPCQSIQDGWDIFLWCPLFDRVGNHWHGPHFKDDKLPEVSSASSWLAWNNEWWWGHRQWWGHLVVSLIGLSKATHTVDLTELQENHFHHQNRWGHNIFFGLRPDPLQPLVRDPRSATPCPKYWQS